MALLKVLLLLLGLGVAVSSVSLQKRVIGGQNCKKDERLYHVVLESFNKSHESLCGGSLISDEWILTAAHCWESDSEWTNIALIGVHPNGLDKAKRHTITHPVIYKDNNNKEHDIMLLKLPEKITSIQPIERPDCTHPLPVGTEVQIAGFGPTKTGIDDTPSNLQCAEIEILQHGSFTIPDNEYQYDHWSCTNSSTKGTAPGDSGGGWVFNNRLYGVHSGSFNLSSGCTKPSYFMDVCSYKKWIDDTIKSSKNNGKLGCLNCG